MSGRTTQEALHQLRRAHHHEIRGALNALRLQLTLLQRGRQKTSPDDPRIGQWIDGAAAEADAVGRALEELSVVERIGEIGFDNDPLRIAQRVTQLLEPLAKTRQVQMSCTAAADGPVLQAQSSVAGLAQALLGTCAVRLASAEPGDSLALEVGPRGVQLTPDSLLLTYDQLSERTP